VITTLRCFQHPHPRHHHHHHHHHPHHRPRPPLHFATIAPTACWRMTSTLPLLMLLLLLLSRLLLLLQIVAVVVVVEAVWANGAVATVSIGIWASSSRNGSRSGCS
jgi:hypothetical protein